MPTLHIWCSTSSKILAETHQTCQKEPKDPSRLRFLQILDPTRSQFSMIAATCRKYFQRCLVHCVRPSSPSFDPSRQRFSFILVPFHAYLQHVLYMFRKASCVPCVISFDLSRNRLDLDLGRSPCGARACWIQIKIDFIKFQSFRLSRRPHGFGGVDRLSWLI